MLRCAFEVNSYQIQGLAQAAVAAIVIKQSRDSDSDICWQVLQQTKCNLISCLMLALVVFFIAGSSKHLGSISFEARK